ncbi:hypothetical protein [Helicobacter ganmani]|uniref:hypothetical protein n=1 Tax=Helicobacter ganmani TaxID=60246 RepID=UPI003A8ABD19
MFDAAFRTLFLSTPARLSLEDKHLCIVQKDKESVKIPLVDILCVMLESHQITLTNALLNAFAQYKIILFACNRICQVGYLCHFWGILEALVCCNLK